MNARDACKRCGLEVARTKSRHLRAHACPHGRPCVLPYSTRRTGERPEPCPECPAAPATSARVVKLHAFDQLGWCDCGVRRIMYMGGPRYVDRAGQWSDAAPECTRKDRHQLEPVPRSEADARARSAASRKAWVTRKHRAFEDTQRPLPFRHGARR